jgi:uncharacterized protein DUF4037
MANVCSPQYPVGATSTLGRIPVVTDFVPGIELNRRFYDVVVGPIMAPWVHSAALLGWGSDVLGYDTERSTDHGWGPRLTVFVEPHDVEAARAAVDTELPESFAGRPVRYGWDDWPVRHYVDIAPLGTWLRGQLGYDASQCNVSTLDWLVTPQQKLLEVVRGAVYHDGLGALGPLRAALAYFPDDLWAWMLACQWQRISQEEPFTGRTAEVGDEIGSRLLAARLAREVMRLHFLYAREYWPYTKWFGTAYARLPGAAGLLPSLHDAVAATDFPSREKALTRVYEAVARMHNDSGLQLAADPAVRPFHGRPFLVLASDRFVDACLAAVTDEMLRTLPPVGSVDQFVDSTDVLSRADYAIRLRAMFGAGSPRSL